MPGGGSSDNIADTDCLFSLPGLSCKVIGVELRIGDIRRKGPPKLSLRDRPGPVTLKGDMSLLCRE